MKYFMQPQVMNENLKQRPGPLGAGHSLDRKARPVVDGTKSDPHRLAYVTEAVLNQPSPPITVSIRPGARSMPNKSGAWRHADVIKNGMTAGGRRGQGVPAG